MRTIGIAFSVLLAGCASAVEQPAPVAELAAAQSGGCAMMEGAGGGMHGAQGGMHGAQGGMHGAQGGAAHGGHGHGMHAGAGAPAESGTAAPHTCPMTGRECPMHGRGMQPTAPATSVPEETYDDDDDDDEGEDEAAANPVRGRAIFTGRGMCHACHGADAKGSALAPNLTDERWLHADGSAESIRGVILRGVPVPREHPGSMPPTGGARLSERDVRDVAEFLVTLQD